jgi:hypothetical protein
VTRPVSLYGRNGAVVLPVGDPVLREHLPDAVDAICRACEGNSVTAAEYIIWVYPHPERPYWPVCSRCLDALAAFFRFWGQP